MKPLHLDRFRRIALGLWGVSCFMPGLLVALSRSPGAGLRVEQPSRLYGPDVAGYLAYCPAPLLAYLMPLLVFSPVLLLLAALGGERRAGYVTGDALRLAAAWGVVNACGLASLSLVIALRRGRDGALGGWALALWLSLLFSGLPSLGLSMLIATWFRSRRVALLVGLFTAGVLGLLGIYARTVGVLWLPGALDQALFAGSNANWWRAAAIACAWCALWVGIAHLCGAQAALRAHRAAAPAKSQ